MENNDLITKEFGGRYMDIGEVKSQLAYSYDADGQKDEDAPTKIAVVISGGGATGLLEGGILEVLHNNGIEPDIILGASAGALNAAGLFYDKLGMGNQNIPDAIKKEYTSLSAQITAMMGVDNKGSRYILDKPEVLESLNKGQLYMKDREIKVTLKGVLIILKSVLAATGKQLGESFSFALLALSLAITYLVSLHVESWAKMFGADPGFCAFTVNTLSVLLGFVLLGYVGYTVWGAAKSIIESIISSKAVFSNERLLDTVYKAYGDNKLDDFDTKITPQERETAAQKIVEKWYADITSNPTGKKIPEFIITGTDLSIKGDALFTLVKEDTYERLVRNGWDTVQVIQNQGDTANIKKYYRSGTPGNNLFLESSQLFNAILSSSALPIIFPTTLLPILIPDQTGQKIQETKTHYYTDGGTLNNTPIHAAIDAGATHIISIELNPLASVHPTSADYKTEDTSEYTMLQTFLRIFFTLNSLATNDDIAKSASWNNKILEMLNKKKELKQHPAIALAGAGAMDEIDKQLSLGDRRIVQIYRIAPDWNIVTTYKKENGAIIPMDYNKTVGIVDFDGRRDDKGEIITTLKEWLDYGIATAEAKAFWRATTHVSPP